MKMEQKRYLIEKIVRSAKIENMSMFIEFAELESTDLEYINEKVKPLGYAVNMEEVLQMQIQKQTRKITNCKDVCGDYEKTRPTPSRREVQPPPPPAQQPQEQHKRRVKYFVPLQHDISIGA